MSLSVITAMSNDLIPKVIPKVVDVISIDITLSDNVSSWLEEYKTDH